MTPTPQRYPATLTLLLLCVLATLLGQGLDGSYFGVTGDALSGLSFMPAAPGRLAGLTTLSAALVHQDLTHLLVNLLLLAPIVLVLEKKHGGHATALLVVGLQLLVLLTLLLGHAVMDLSAFAFLGASHLTLGLYAFWGLTEKRFLALGMVAATLAAGFFQQQSSATLMAHALGASAGLCLGLVALVRLQRPRRP